MSRVYVGHLPPRCTEKEVEKFFRGYGRLRDVVLKSGYGFVEFENEKDADDAVYDLHGTNLRDERIVVEHARLPPGPRGGAVRRNTGRDRRFGPPTRTEYRVIVENLSSRVSWQDLKDMMRKAGDVTYADAHKSAKNDGIVEFAAYADMKEAILKFDNYELYGRRLHVYEDKPIQRSRSRSDDSSRSNSRRRYRRSRSRESVRRKSHSRRRSRSDSRRNRYSGKRSRDDSVGRSRSRSQRSASRNSRSRSQRRSIAGSCSPNNNGRELKNGSTRRSRSISGSRSRSRSRSADTRSRHSRSRTKSESASHASRSGSQRTDEGADGSRSDGARSHEPDYE